MKYLIAIIMSLFMATSAMASPTETIKTIIDESKMRDTVQTLDDHLHKDRIGRYILGKNNYTNHKDLFDRYIVLRLSDQFELYQDVEIIIVHEFSKGKFDFVDARTNTDIQLEFRLQDNLLVDLKVEGLSLARSIREEFRSVMSTRGLDYLLLNLTEEITRMESSRG